MLMLGKKNEEIMKNHHMYLQELHASGDKSYLADIIISKIVWSDFYYIKAAQKRICRENVMEIRPKVRFQWRFLYKFVFHNFLGR